ncbi:ankyrin repeat-containing protein ITN1-like [Pistacia vera]|uniref:ankyrin repeat-containing protein ITN1-like n=1 Tax=Pistacia vera TaxID=55513 RepID=UPI001263B5B3|nr:ankyrin repeat-containing protein ITN1-like [Pistacia vera]
MTPLHVASSQGNLKVIEKILFHSPQCCELVHARGWNFLHFAMVSLHEEDVDVLLQNPLARSLIHQKDAKGNTPLHVLAASKRNNSFELNSINLKHKSNLRVINRQNINVKHILSYGFPELEQEIQALTKDVCNGQRPRGVICSRRKPNSENVFELDPKERDTHLIVAALIATVTFAAAFTVPAGYQSEKGQNQGTAILSRNYHFQTFIIADLIAMFLSLSAILFHFSMEFKFFREVLFLFDTAVVGTIFALIAMVIAFVSGIRAVLLPPVGLFSAILCICIGFCILVSGIMVKVIIDEWREQKLRTNQIETSRNGSAT